jgi:hypothetical protein
MFAPRPFLDGSATRAPRPCLDVHRRGASSLSLPRRRRVAWLLELWAGPEGHKCHAYRASQRSMTSAWPGGLLCPAWPDPIGPCLARVRDVPGRADRVAIYTCVTMFVIEEFSG